MTNKLIVVRNDIQKLSTVRNDDEKTILCPQRQVKNYPEGNEIEWIVLKFLEHHLKIILIFYFSSPSAKTR